MSEPFARLRRFLRELKRRNVYKVAVAYLAVAFVGLQAVDLLIPATTLPSWADAFLLAILIVGFPVAVVVAWAFEMTPEGMRRTETPQGEEPVGAGFQWFGLALVVLVAGGVWYWTAGGQDEAATEATSTPDTAARTASTLRDTAGPPRIAVLPFENIARDTGDAFFARGMHEEVLNQLSKVSGLEVLSRTTMMEMADAEMTAVEIGRELDASAILEGTVRRAGNRLRITTQLIDARQDAHLWSKTYARELEVDEIFQIQADIAEQVAGALETELTGGERRRIASAPTDNLAAYDAYLRGRNGLFQSWATQEASHLRRSVEALRQAVRRDPSFGEAYAWLGLVYAARTEFGGDDHWLDSASVALERAEAIEPDLAATHVARGHLYRIQFPDSTAARITTLRRALELQPSDAFARSRLSDALAADGQYVEAIREAYEAVRLAPRHPPVLTEMAEQLAGTGFYGAAAAWCRRILEIQPGNVEVHWHLARNQRAQGRPDDAMATWNKMLGAQGELPPPVWWEAARAALQADRPERAREYMRRLAASRRSSGSGEAPSRPMEAWLTAYDEAVLGLAELRLGNTGRGRALLTAARDSFRASLDRGEEGAGPGYQFFLAEVNAGLGQREKAFRYLEKWADYQSYNGYELLVSPFFDELRSEARFQSVVEQVYAERRKARRRVRELNLDLYPPGAESDSVGQSARASN